MNRSASPILAVVVGTLAVAAGAVAFGTTASSALAAGCTPGTKTIAGAPARVFCGPAHATVQIGTRKLALAGGSCERLGSTFTLNIGTLSFAPKSRLPYLGISLSAAHAGRLPRPTVAINANGRHASLRSSSAVVTLAPGLKKGSFAGRELAGAAIRGTFSC